MDVPANRGTRGFRLRTITRTYSLRWFFFLEESNSRLTTAAQTDDLRWNDEAELSKWKRTSFQRVRRREDENTSNKENKNKKIRKCWYGQKRKNILISFETLLSPRREMSEEMSVSPVAPAVAHRFIRACALPNTFRTPAHPNPGWCSSAKMYS